MPEESYPINLWVNEERYEKLLAAGIAGMAREVLAGLKVVQVPASAAQKDAILAKFPTAKFDTATTRTIELLPRKVKDRLFDLVVARRSVDVAGEFLATLG